MKITIDHIKMLPDMGMDEIHRILEREYSVSVDEFTVLRKSLDARKKSSIHYTLKILIEVPDSDAERILKNINTAVYEEKTYPNAPESSEPFHTVIIGAGPAGLFAALRIIRAGGRVTLIERGKPAEERMPDIKELEETGNLNTESNVLFGEGGAGTYSDGKLTTRTNRPESRWLFEQLVEHGAPSEILYESKPHLGTDILRSIVKSIRTTIKSSGSEILFSTRADEIISEGGNAKGVRTSDGREILCNTVILATGHSARDTYRMLFDKNICLEKKGFAVGMRAEHPADLIAGIQYGNSSYRNILPAAEYSLTWNNPKTKRGVYSFCMCPGGRVINSSSENNMLCTNGMSFSARDLSFSNAAIVVTVSPDDTENHPLAGIEFQRQIESAAFIAGKGGFTAPAQRIASFMKRKTDATLPKSSYLPGITPSDMNAVLPDFISDEIRTALKFFERKMYGFTSSEGIFIGTETRTSSPVRITRGKDYQSVSLKGLYPAGEGAGYAGGIVSSAVDGIRIADSIIQNHCR